MKRLLLLVVICAAALSAYSQVPQTLSYQGILVDNAGAPVGDGSGNNVHFEFYDAVTAGNLLYQTGTITGVTTYKGMFTFTIGTGLPTLALNPVIPTSIWNQKVWVQVQANGNTLTPRIELSTVPYAFVAERANTMDATGLTGTVANTVLDADLQDLADGSLTGSKVGTGIVAANITTGTIAVANGGTNANTAAGARTNLGLGSVALLNTITTTEITDGTIATGDLANNAVTTAKMATTGVVANTYGSAALIPVITVDASGRITTVTTAGTGTVTNVTGTAPIAVATGTTTPVISIPKATPAVDGYLTASDFATFNAKQGAITATNGLTIATNTLSLGGTLTANTALASGGFAFNYAGAGNFGIGAPTPLNKLDVGGSQVIGNGYAGINTAPVNGLLVQGPVGLGTTTPVNKLDVEGGVAIGATYSGTTVAPTNGLIVEGYTGIGINAPVFPLDVNTQFGATSTKLGPGRAIFTVANAPMVGFNTYWGPSGYTLNAAGAGGMITFGQEVTNGFSFNTAPSGTAGAAATMTSRMSIGTNGNVGIGTTTPSTAGLLHVAGSDVAVDGTLYKGMVWVSGNTMQAHMHRYGASNNALYVTNSGGSDLQGVYLASGATSWTSTSDRRLKENIRETTYGLNTVLQLPVKEFNFKTSKEKNVIGFIAQDVYPIIPELVEKGDDGEYTGSGGASTSVNSTFRPWGVDYGGLTPVLVKAIQEQQKQIEELKANVAQLKLQASQYEGLSAQVEELKKLVMNKASQASDPKSTMTGSTK